MGDIDDLIAERERLRDELRVQSQPLIDKISALTEQIKAIRSSETQVRQLQRKTEKAQKYRAYLEKRYERDGGLIAFLAMDRTQNAPIEGHSGQCSMYGREEARWYKRECRAAGVAPIFCIWRCLDEGEYEILGLHFCKEHATEIAKASSTWHIYVASEREAKESALAPNDPPR